MYIEGSGTGSLTASHALSPDLCQDKCNTDHSCAAFETNTELGTCQLDSLVGPSSQAISGQTFCSKLCMWPPGTAYKVMLIVNMLGTGHFILESHLAPMYVLEAGAALGDPPLSIFYSGKDSQLWRFEGNVMVDRRGLVLEYNGQTGIGNFIMAEKSGAEDQKFNIDGFMFQSMVNTWAIDIPGFNADGQTVYLYPQHGKTNQLWNVITVLLSKEGRNNTVKPLKLI